MQPPVCSVCRNNSCFWDNRGFYAETCSSTCRTKLNQTPLCGTCKVRPCYVGKGTTSAFCTVCFDAMRQTVQMCAVCHQKPCWLNPMTNKYSATCSKTCQSVYGNTMCHTCGVNSGYKFPNGTVSKFCSSCFKMMTGVGANISQQSSTSQLTLLMWIKSPYKSLTRQEAQRIQPEWENKIMISHNIPVGFWFKLADIANANGIHASIINNHIQTCITKGNMQGFHYDGTMIRFANNHADTLFPENAPLARWLHVYLGTLV